MKKLILVLALYSTIAFAQTGFVEINHVVYPFLERMKTMSVLEDYSSFDLPKTRNLVAKNLVTIHKKKNILGEIDKNLLSDFLHEFSYDINYAIEKTNLLPDFQPSYFLTENEKYLYSYYDSSQFSLFVNFIGDVQQLSHYDNSSKNAALATIIKFGGEIKGSFGENIGYSILANNGTFFGNRKLVQQKGSLQYNYKFNLSDSIGIGDDYFDETAGYFTWQNEFANFKIGRDRINIGHGYIKEIVSSDYPNMDYFAFDLKYKFFKFTYFHAKLLGSKSSSIDPIQGDINFVTEKFMGYHRFGFDLGKNTTLGLGEIIIYSNRSLDLSYVNPFNFYKSAEHANQDRDNSMLFADFANYSIPNLKLYVTILIDDIDFSKLGTGWFGNQTYLSSGFTYASSLFEFPINIHGQIIRIDPYVFTHRISDNNFSQLSYNIGPELEPNSITYFIGSEIYFHHRIKLFTGFRFGIHGANVEDSDGNTLINHGGSISQGIRFGDNNEAFFLDGAREILRGYSLKLTVEPINNYTLYFHSDYSVNSLDKYNNIYEIKSAIGLFLRI